MSFISRSDILICFTIDLERQFRGVRFNHKRAKFLATFLFVLVLLEQTSLHKAK